MSADIEIESLLSELGLGREELGEGREVLEAEGLTRPGKVRISLEKAERAKAVVHQSFAIHCQSQGCISAARASGRKLVLATAKQQCGVCGGSENARAADDLVRAGITRLVVVGGTPATRQELERLLGSRIELRLVDGTHHRPSDRAKADLEWSDRVLLWGATELHHKVSKQYADVSATKQKIVHIPRRGISQLLAAAIESVRRRAG